MSRALSRRWLALCVAIAGCAGLGRYTRAGGAIGALAVRPVDWNPARADVGRVQGLVDDGDRVAILSDKGAFLLRAGGVAAHDAAITTWRGGAPVPAADGNGRWLVALDGAGRVARWRDDHFEPVAARWALEQGAITALASVGPVAARRAAFLGDGTLAVSDARSVARFDAPRVTHLAAGGGVIALLDDRGVRVLDLRGRQPTERRLALARARDVAVDDGGRVYATTERAVYREDDAHALTLAYLADGATLHGLAAGGMRAWFADGTELGLVEPSRVRVTTGAQLDAHARLEAAAGGAVWAIADGTLRRYAVDEGVTAARDWSVAIAPVFARACAACHLPDGSAEVDLSTEAAWRARRDLIRDKVLAKRAMPPSGHPLSDEDRAAIAAWLAD